MTDQAPGSGRPRVTVLNSPLIGQEYVLGGPFAAIGRNPECEVQLDLVSISRRHAVIEEAGGRFIVRDLGSRNGIKVGGRPVAQAELHDGDVIGVGEVDLRFERGTPAAASAPSVAPLPARALTSADILSASSMRHEGEGEAAPAEDARAARRDPRLVVAIVLGLVIAGAVGYLVVRPSNPGANTRVKKLAPVLVEVNGNRIVSWAADWGDFHPGNILIDESAVLGASRYDERCLLITGKSGGNATVTVKTKAGLTLTCRVLVRGRVSDPVEELTFGAYTKAERMSMARRFASQAAFLEREKPFLALRKYEEAAAVLKPLPSKGELYMNAKRRAEALSKTITERWKKLEKDIKIAAGNNDLTRVEELVADAVALIPDENDPRHQMAVATRTQVLLRVLREKNR